VSSLTPHILVCDAYDPSAIARLEAVGRVTVLPKIDESELRRAIEDCDALLVRTCTRVTRDVLKRGKRLRVVGRGGVGLENIDVDAAREYGIEVVHTPAAATQAVADLTVGLMLALLRRVTESDRLIRAGRFDQARALPPAREMSELTIGVVGMGRIGRAVGRRCSLGFGTRVVFNDIQEVDGLDFPAAAFSKSELYRVADVVSLHVPLTDRTEQMINADSLELFQRAALLVNTARGRVVDSNALADALSSGRLGGAALDVFDPEPMPADHPLFRAANTVFTPHAGARTVAGQRAMNDVVDDVIRILKGQPPYFPAPATGSRAS
jgi:D-3-phosphoglycerate dehydrogenase